MRWDVILKSKLKTQWGLTSNDKPKVLGYFEGGNSSFLLYPILDSFFFAVHSFILVDGKSGGNSITIRLRFSLSGLISIFGILVITSFLFNLPESIEGELFITVAVVGTVLNTVYQWFRHIKKVEKMVEKMITIAAERSKG